MGLKIGSAVWIGTRQSPDLLQGVQSLSNSGIKYIEITAPKAGQSASIPQTFGAITHQERTAVREKGKLDGILYCTHSTIAVRNLSGQEQNGTFSETSRAEMIRENTRAIIFGSDVAKGGAVTIHLTDYLRSIFNLPYEPGWFKLSPDEKYETDYYLANRKTGEVIKAFGEMDEIEIPVQARNEKGELIWFLDNDNRPLNIKTFNQGIPIPAVDSHGIAQVRRMSFHYYRKLPENKDISAGKAALKLFRQLRLLNIGLSLLPIMEREEIAIRNRARLKKLKDARDYYKKIIKSIPHGDRWRYDRLVPDALDALGLGIAGDIESALTLLDREINKVQIEIALAGEASASARQKARDLLQLLDDLCPMQDLALERSIKSYVQLACLAMERSSDPNNPLFISLEPISPEFYGSHPQEIKQLVYLCRKKMSLELQEKGHSKSQSDELAAKHIKITLDIGHLALWWRYFSAYPHLKQEERLTIFNQWIIQQCRDLLRSGLVGHVHWSNNDGYADEHNILGGGILPYKQIAQVFEEEGYQGIIILETQSNGDFLHGFYYSCKFLGLLPDILEELIKSQGLAISIRTLIDNDFRDSPFSGSYFGIDL